METKQFTTKNDLLEMQRRLKITIDKYTATTILTLGVLQLFLHFIK